MGATGECSAGPHTQCTRSMCIDSDLFRPVTSSVMINFTYPFTVEDYLFKTQNTEFSDMPLYRLDMTTKFHRFCPKNCREITRNFALQDCYTRPMPFIHLIAFKEKIYLDCQNIIQYTIMVIHYINSLRPRRNRRHFADDIFKCIFLNENEWISLRIWLKFVPKVRINNIPSLVQIMAWRRLGDKPLSEPLVVSLLTPICVTRPRWVKRMIPLAW